MCRYTRCIFLKIKIFEYIIKENDQHPEAHIVEHACKCIHRTLQVIVQVAYIFRKQIYTGACQSNCVLSSDLTDIDSVKHSDKNDKQSAQSADIKYPIQKRKRRKLQRFLKCSEIQQCDKHVILKTAFNRIPIYFRYLQKR